MFYGYVQQSGMYETIALRIIDEYIEDYSDYYKNNDRWYLSIQSENLKTVIEHLWFVYDKEIDVYLEDHYVIDIDTIKIMFAEKFLT